MHDAVPDELGVLEAGNHMEDALLFAEGQVGLETNQVIGRLLLVLGAQLNCRPGTATGARVGESNGLHGAKTDGILARARDLLGRLAGLEQVPALKVLEHHAIGRGERLDKGLVLFLVERGIQIVATPLLLVARLREQHVHIDNRGGRVKERQGVTTDKLHDLLAQCRRAQGTRGDNHMTLGDLGDLTVDNLDIGAGGNLGLDKLGKLDAVDRQGAASGNGRTMSAVEQHRTLALELGILQTGGGIGTGRLKRIGADELCQMIGMVGRGAHLGAHLAQLYGEPAICQLNRAFRSRQTATDNRHLIELHLQTPF